MHHEIEWREYMKKKIIALLLVFGMMFESIGSITSYAGQIQDHEVIDEITSDDSKESVEGAQEDNKIEQTTQEDTILVEEDEKGLEKPEEEVSESEVMPDIEKTGGFHGEINVDEHAISVVDKDGNVSYIDVSGDDTIVGETTMFRTATSQIVNLRKTSGVLNYTEVATGEAGYIAGAYGADAAYLGESNGKVKFMLAGVIGQIEASKVEIVGINSAKSISYYAVSNGRLYHYISTNVNVENYGIVLDNGAAPSYLKSGTKYYSYDGHYFYTESNFGNMISDYNEGTRTHSVNSNSPYYNYFQYLPLRSQSNYSGNALNTIIDNKVAENSKMKNTGVEFVEKQNTYGVNALLIAGLAANESAWGSSNIAQNKNNLFGLNAVDSSPGQSANYFESVEQCINEFAEKWMSKEYLSPKNWKYFGGFLGNKASGINVKYASDPYWGEKAAAMAWNLDKASGNKDVNKYTIGIKDVIEPDNTVNIRKESNTSSTILFKSPKQSNCAYIILNQTPVNKFYKIQSDGVLNSGRTSIDASSGVYDFTNMYVYISSNYVKIVSEGNGSQTEPELPEKPDEKPNPKVPTVSVPTSVKNAITYSSHMATTGWESNVKNGEQSGVTGLSRPMEGIKINISGISNLGVKYSAHVSGIGWQSWVNGGQLGGTTGKSKSMEAIKIELTGSAANQYDIHYRVHVQGIGWTKYVSNGEVGGTTGKSKHIEAIQIVLLQKEKDELVSSSLANIIQYSTNSSTLGWLGTSTNGKQSGTVGMSSALTGIKIQTKGVAGLGVKYSTHIPNVGWQSYVSDGKESNAISTPKRLEAIKIELTGNASSKYDIYYRVHAQKYGWLGWAKNGAMAGTQGCNYHMEAIQIVVTKKGSAAPGDTSDAFIAPLVNVNYSTHVQKEGWQQIVKNGEISGTIGKSFRLEAIKINLSNQKYSGNIQYSTHIQNIGWQSAKKNNQISGTEGLSKRLEAIKIELTGEMATYYDIYYRVHAQTYGWLGWAKNGNPAGTEGLSKRLEAIEIKIVSKGSKPPSGSGSAYIK